MSTATDERELGPETQSAPTNAQRFQPGDLVWIGVTATIVDDPDTPQGAVAITYDHGPNSQVWYVSPGRLELIERAGEVAP